MTLSKIKRREILKKVQDIDKISGKDLKAVYITAFLLLIFVGPAYIFMFKILPISLSDILMLIPVIVIGSIIMLLFYFMGYSVPKSRRTNRELALLENFHEETSKKLIVKTFGKQIYRTLNVNDIEINNKRLCKELLKQDEVKNNVDLKLYIYAKLHKAYLIDENYNQAIEVLNSALKIKPGDIIVMIWIAEAFECIRNIERAISSYELILSTQKISSTLKEYVDAQIQRIKIYGTKKMPITGLKYMTY